MRTSENIGELTKAMAQAQAEMKNAPLNKINPHYKSRYADLSAVRDATVPALSKNGLTITQAPGFSEQGLVLYTRLAHANGEWLEAEYPLVIGNPQQMGSALTYARRYCWAAICGIAADEDDDANVASTEAHRESAKRASPQRADRASVAQQTVEQPPLERDVAGSTPAVGANPQIARATLIADELRQAAENGGEEAVRRKWRVHEPEIMSFTSQKIRSRLEEVFYELVPPPDDTEQAIADLEGRVEDARQGEMLP